MLVLAHGAGAGMEHAFMTALAADLAAHGVASFRYQFPYTERGSRRPDPPALLEATVRSAVEAAGPGDVSLIAGKGHEKYQEIGGRVLPFDDVAVAREALAARRMRKVG